MTTYAEYLKRSLGPEKAKKAMKKAVRNYKVTAKDCKEITRKK